VFTGTGNLSPYKGVEEFIRAASIIHNQNPEAYFLWAGKDDHSGFEKFKDEMRKLIILFHLEDHFFFLGYRNDIPQILKDSDVFVMISHQEAFGNVYIEAMAMGLPVIGGKGGGVPEIIKPDKNGFLCPAKNPVKLAEYMEFYIHDKKKYKEHSKNSLEYCQKFSMENHIQNLIDIYEEESLIKP
jgi:glycosyltransferase involved in cell wall biosynthesis